MLKQSDRRERTLRALIGLAAFLAATAVAWFGLGLLGHTVKLVTVALGGDPSMWSFGLLLTNQPGDLEVALGFLFSISMVFFLCLFAATVLMLFFIVMEWIGFFIQRALRKRSSARGSSPSPRPARDRKDRSWPWL